MPSKDNRDLPGGDRINVAISSIGELKRVIESTERDFLSIGSKLLEFSSQADEISKASLSAAGIMFGDEMKGAVNGINSMLDRLQHILQRAGEQSGRNLDNLQNAHRGLKDVDTLLGSLDETSDTLKMLGLSTKIQSARLPQDETSFRLLADDIKDLSFRVKRKTGELDVRVNSIAGMVREVLHRYRTLMDDRQRLTDMIMLDSTAVLNTIQQIAGKASGVAREIAELSDEISRNLSDVVVSIQFQDITRQELEGVIAGLETGKTPIDGGFAEQGRALRSTSDKLKKASSVMLISLRSISSNTGRVSDETTLAYEAAVKFHTDLERSASTVTSFLTKAVGYGRDMSETMSMLLDNVEEMSGFTDEIEDINEEVELIAMNAHVKARQIGGNGAGIGVIADAIQRTADESNYCGNSITGVFSAITATAKELREHVIEEAREKKSEQDLIVRELAQTLDSLRYMQERVVSILKKLNTDSASLSEEISGKISAITIHEKASSMIDSVAGELESATALSEEQSRETTSMVCSEDEGIDPDWIAEGSGESVPAAEAPQEADRGAVQTHKKIDDSESVTLF